MAILDAGLTCSASLPCPAEMGASIHISGTKSSIIDTVFVCRTVGTVPENWMPNSSQGVADLVSADLGKLRNGNVKPTLGDTRCIAYGHLIRLAIWHLRNNWDKTVDVGKRIMAVDEWLRDFGGWPEVEKHLESSRCPDHTEPRDGTDKYRAEYGVEYADISF